MWLINACKCGVGVLLFFRLCFLSQVKYLCPAGVYGSSYYLGSPSCSAPCSLGDYCPAGSTAPASCPRTWVCCAARGSVRVVCAHARVFCLHAQCDKICVALLCCSLCTMAWHLNLPSRGAMNAIPVLLDFLFVCGPPPAGSFCPEPYERHDVFSGFYTADSTGAAVSRCVPCGLFCFQAYRTSQSHLVPRHCYLFCCCCCACHTLLLPWDAGRLVMPEPLSPRRPGLCACHRDVRTVVPHHKSRVGPGA